MKPKNTSRLFFILFLINLLPGLAFGQNQSKFAEEFAPMWERVRQYTLEVAEAMPEKHYRFKVTEDSKSFADEVAHIVDNFYFLMNNFIVQEPDTEAYRAGGKSKKELLEKLDFVFDMFAKQIPLMTEADLQKKVQFFTGDYYSKERMFYLAKDHTTHHRSKMIVCLKIKGIAIPEYVGW